MSGKAYLTGAGPGRVDWITVRGLHVLKQAEVVIYDRLIASELLQEAPPDAEFIYVGKESGQHTMPQEEITRLVVDRVAQGKQVVRLKGGDPYVFGRGGEEALALAQAGLQFEVIPGISSAIGVPASAGIPVTHRGIATAFAVVTGHEAPGKDQSGTDWAALAHIPTLVILMGLENAAQIFQALINAGRQPDTPAAVIRQGATSEQIVLAGTIQTLPDQITEFKLTPPAIMIVGEVVHLADILGKA